MGVVVASVILSFGAGTVLAQVNVIGEFDGTLGGYGDGAGEDQKPNEIVVDGQFTVEGEPAQQVEVVVQSERWTVLDTGSVSVFVEGDTSVEFNQRVTPNAVRLTTDEIPADTTVQVSFSTIYTGGTDSDEIDAGTVTVEYESAGGSAGEQTFTANASMANSPENRIAEVQNGDDGDNGDSLLIPGIVGGAVVIVIAGFIIWRRWQRPKWDN